MKHLLPLFFALLKFGSGYFLINGAYELQRDEYLYLNQGQHLWGYLEVPPLIAAQGWVTLQLGGGEAWVKFWPFLWGAATSRQHAIPQDYADMLGWRELADKTWAAYLTLPPAVRPHTVILCGNYGQASAINYYNRGRALPPASSFNGSFVYWYPAHIRPQAFILVDVEPNAHLAPHFATFRRAGAVANPYACELGTTITVGLRPDSLARAYAHREWRRTLAEWDGPAPLARRQEVERLSEQASRRARCGQALLASTALRR